MQSIITKIAFLLVAFIATAAQAQKSQFYGGLDAVMPYGATWEVVNSPVEKLSVGTKIKPILGCTFNDRWAMEFGRFYVEATKGSVSESITIFPINLVYNTPLSEKTSFVFKGGGAPFRAKFSHPSYYTSDGFLGLSLGIGLKYQISQSVSLVGGVDFLHGFRVTLVNKSLYKLSPANAYLGLRRGF